MRYEGDSDFFEAFRGFFVTLLSRFGRGVATWDWSNLTEPRLRNVQVLRLNDKDETFIIYYWHVQFVLFRWAILHV